MVVLIAEVAASWHTGEILLPEVEVLFFRVGSDRRCALALEERVALRR